MAQNGDFRQQAVATANLLLEAASLLESSQGTGVEPTPQQQSLQRPSPHAAALGRTSLFSGEQSGPSRPSATAELRGLFDWNCRSTKSSKRKASSLGLGLGRVTLKMAGLGERRLLSMLLPVLRICVMN